MHASQVFLDTERHRMSFVYVMHNCWCVYIYIHIFVYLYIIYIYVHMYALCTYVCMCVCVYIYHNYIRRTHIISLGENQQVEYTREPNGQTLYY